MNLSTTEENSVKEFCNCVAWYSDHNTKWESRLPKKNSGKFPAFVKCGENSPKRKLAFFL